MTGVFICRCGGNISGTVNCEEVKNSVKDMEGVKTTRVTDFLCSKPGLQLIKDEIRKKDLEKVVVACCSPHMHEKMFQKVIEEENVNKYQMVHVNIREHCSWIHDKNATPKAINLVKGGIKRAQELEPLEEIEIPVSKEVLVIGGGVAGITAALQLSEAGYKVNLIERNPSIGGRMAQLSKTFPTLDCSPCILSPRMAEVETDENIVLYTSSDLQKLTGGPGNFHVSIKQRAKGVDPEKCLKCGNCSQVCPIEVPSEFEEGLYKRKAIYLPFPQAVPSSYTVDFENCIGCQQCVKACPVDAIDLSDEDKNIELDVGSIIVATGFDLIDKGKLRSYHPENENVFDALQVERLIENELTEGKVLTTKDGDRVKSLAYILCAGSRDPHRGVSYCSSICCPYTIKQAILLKKFLPYLKIFIYYTDMRMTGRGFEDFYREAREKGIMFIHGKPAEITPLSKGLEIIVEDLDTGLLTKNVVDYAVLASAMVPSHGTTELANKLGIALGEDHFIASKHVKLDPISTLKEGIFAAGVATGTKDIHDSVIDARAAASHTTNFLGEGKLRLDPFKPIIVGDCDHCGQCVEICEKDAIRLEDTGPVIELASCTGCGACVAICKNHSLKIPNYTREAILGEVQGLLEDTGEEIALIGFFDDNISYTAADNAGTARLHYPTNMRVVRTPSTALLDIKILLKTLGSGADGVMISEVEESHEAELAEKLIEETRKILQELGIEQERVMLQPMVLPIFKMLPKFISDFTQKIRSLGKIPLEKRQKLFSYQI
jgi:heterodisulfide reductase subunit A